MEKIGIERNMDDIIISDLEMQIKVLYITDDDQDMSCLMWLLKLCKWWITIIDIVSLFNERYIIIYITGRQKWYFWLYFSVFINLYNDTWCTSLYAEYIEKSLFFNPLQFEFKLFSLLSFRLFIVCKKKLLKLWCCNSWVSMYS